MNHYQGGIHGHKYGDTEWIHQQIDKLPIAMQNGVKARYSEIYDRLEGQDNQRFRANRWLAKVAEKYGVKFDTNEIAF